MSTSELTIPHWASEDRPREKLLAKGRTSLTDAELIGILIGSGTATMTAIDLAKIILKSVDNDINRLAKLSVKDLIKFKGIGEAKAISIVSALELGRRRKTTTDVNTIIQSSTHAYEELKPYMLDLYTEEFWTLCLNRRNQVVKSSKISAGGFSSTVVDPKVVFKEALDNQACAIILAHNHPSGNLNPSQADISLTEKLKKAGEFLEIPVLDHIIFTNNGYFSFADEQMM